MDLIGGRWREYLDAGLRSSLKLFSELGFPGGGTGKWVSFGGRSFGFTLAIKFSEEYFHL
jgi:hypothetical protein